MNRDHILTFHPNILFLGGAIFIHAFGAYFGLAVSIMHRRRNMALSENMESSKYASDIFAMVCELKIYIHGKILS